MRSAVAGVLDGYGGWHVVVGHPEGLHHHVREGQFLVVVPRFTVVEPVAWDFVPKLIKRVERYLLWWAQTRNDPDVLDHPAVKLFQLQRLRTYQRGSVNLCDIVET